MFTSPTHDLRRLARAALAASAALLSAPALGQPITVAETTARMGNWTFVPIINLASGTGRVDSFLALADTDSLNGEALRAVWYVRGIDDESEWASKSWVTTEPWDAVKSVKVARSLGDDSDPVWERVIKFANNRVADEARIPVDYVKGVLADDPLAAALSVSPLRDQLVESLVELGHTAADIPIEKATSTAACTLKYSLTGLAKAAESSSAGAAGENAVNAYRAFVQSKCVAVLCFPWTWSTPKTPLLTPAGAFGPPTWTPTAPTLTVGGTIQWCNYACTSCRTITWTETTLSLFCTVTTVSYTATQCYVIATASCSGPGPCPGTPSCTGTPTPAVPAPGTPTTITPTAPVPVRPRFTEPFVPSPADR
ncbi:MAG: hypothetical protein K2Q09_08585 [Phycisphaerales bacterium]|nr:hypothetical protein [Phycisphaerales bacterium]